MRIHDTGGYPDIPGTSESSETPISPDQLLGEIGLTSEVVREILDDVSSEPALDLRGEG